MYEKEGVYFSIVQGKRVDYSPRRINSLLGLPVLEVCDVERRRIAHNWPEGQHAWNELLVGLMKEGKWWIWKTPTNNPQRINTDVGLQFWQAHLMWSTFSWLLSVHESKTASSQIEGFDETRAQREEFRVRRRIQSSTRQDQRSDVKVKQRQLEAGRFKFKSKTVSSSGNVCKLICRTTFTFNAKHFTFPLSLCV